MTDPAVSVIMLTYNRERYLQESISSVLSQTFSDLELIIVDDGSNDNSELLIKQISDTRIRYYKFEHTGHASRLRNFGINQSCGKFVAFIDSDDIWLPEKIQFQLNALKDFYPTIGFTFTNVIEFTNDGSILKNGIYKNLWTHSFEGNVFDLYVQSKFAIYPSSMLFNKRCLEITGPLDELFPWTDNDFFHRLAFHYEGAVITTPLVRIRKHAENTSSTLGQETVKEMICMLSNFLKGGIISNYIFRKMTAHYYYLSGILYLRTHQKALAQKAFVNCLRYNPLKTKAWIRSTLSILNIPQRS